MSIDPAISSAVEGLKVLQPKLEAASSSDPAVGIIKEVVSAMLDNLIVLTGKVVSTELSQHDSAVRTAKTEQYSRRNTTVLVGLPIDVSEANPSQSNLVAKVTSNLFTISGITVKSSDISAVHRSTPPKARTNTRNRKPPSVTVCFHNFNLKDTVLQKYTNYDN